MDTNIILDFLNDLELNNSSEWMKENKLRYDRAKAEFENIIQELINRISYFDVSYTGLTPANMIFRLNRDIRFSKDKSPYTPAFRAHISPAGKYPIPVGYFIHIKPHNILLGGGIYTSQIPEATKLIRKHISDNSNDFLDIINNPDFSMNFVIQGEKLKKVPKEYSDKSPVSEYLKHKSWDIYAELEDNCFLQSDLFIDEIVHKIKFMKPFNDFINKGLSRNPK
ncbi:DUF2461 domain-containing protein [uncultured Parabacteroides sp.]|uniref:DUF2461 domain-containing protein n=1 Tax=Parabacteroides goldsteinii TaxID=328812 RepID=UPI002594CE31|nr:DUF2461 domain-containing protein [uncultured Parabacteroides sp.]